MAADGESKNEVELGDQRVQRGHGGETHQIAGDGPAEPDHAAGRAGRRRPELAAGRRARAGRCWKTSTSARRSSTSTTSASPSASSTPAASARTASSRTTSRWPTSPRPTCSSARARRRRRSCGSRPSPAARARPTWRATSAASRSSSTRKEGNWDLVGNNIPVFFIQDAIKFPDLIHAVKQEPDRGVPAGADRARQLLGLHLAHARSHAHGHVDHVRPDDPAVVPLHGGLRRPHLPPGQRRRASRRSSSSTGSRSSACSRWSGTRR